MKLSIVLTYYVNVAGKQGGKKVLLFYVIVMLAFMSRSGLMQGHAGLSMVIEFTSIGYIE